MTIPKYLEKLKRIDEMGNVDAAIATLLRFCQAMRAWDIRSYEELLTRDGSPEADEQATEKVFEWLEPIYREFCPGRKAKSRDSYGSYPPQYPESHNFVITRTLEKGDEVWIYANLNDDSLGYIRTREYYFTMKKVKDAWRVSKAMLKVDRKYEEVSP